ncbi:hypothetical protein R3P38DRAFT_73849 [Favolaschia claudopus]|uniref:DUF6533 domain-containing protein n=1 Tax=Favolaschia claudopus TaxID=2862362 RepID=A0AAW0D1Z8_9AGAR
MIESLTDVEIEQQIQISRYLVLIPFALVLYEYAITFELEVARYWGTPMTWANALFYLNRYSLFVGTIPIFAELLSTTTDPSKVKACRVLEIFHICFALISQIIVAAMLIMRTYALYERNKRVLALTVSVTVAAVGIALVMILSGRGRDTLDPHLQAFGCPSATTHDSNIRIAAAWSGMLVFDVLIFVLTVYKALRYETRGGHLFSVLFRDGSLYFGIMIAANAGNIASYVMGGPIASGSPTTLVNVLSSVMLTRLMLNMRDPKILRGSGRRSWMTRMPASTTRDGSDDLPPMTTLMEPYLGTEIAMETFHREDTDRNNGRI